MTFYGEGFGYLPEKSYIFILKFHLLDNIAEDVSRLENLHCVNRSLLKAFNCIIKSLSERLPVDETTRWKKL